MSLPTGERRQLVGEDLLGGVHPNSVYLDLVRTKLPDALSNEIDDERLDDLTLAVSEACSIAVAADDKPDRRLVVAPLVQ